MTPSDGSSGADPAGWERRRQLVLRESLAIGVAVGALGVSFGALGTTSGLSVTMTCALSVLMFTGGSQFAFVGVFASGGGLISATLTGLLLGVRNSLYGLRLAPTLGVKGSRRALAAQFVIDETTAVAVSNEDDDAAFRLGFWATGITTFVVWNAFTLLGALLGQRVGDPATLGLDAAVPAAFLALLWPRLIDAQHRIVAAGAALVAVVATPLVRPGLPVLLAGLVAVVAVMPWLRRAPQ